jgi:hypothetical protein
VIVMYLLPRGAQLYDVSVQDYFDTVQFASGKFVVLAKPDRA